MEEHIASCPDCKELLEQDTKLLALLKQPAVSDPGEEYWQNLEKSIASKIADRKISEEALFPEISRRNIWRYLPALAAVIILLVIANSNLSFIRENAAPESLAAGGYVYDAGIIGHYLYESSGGGYDSQLLPDLMATIPLSAPGLTGYNIAIMVQIETLEGGHN